MYTMQFCNRCSESMLISCSSRRLLANSPRFAKRRVGRPRVLRRDRSESNGQPKGNGGPAESEVHATSFRDGRPRPRGGATSCRPECRRGRLRSRSRQTWSRSGEAPACGRSCRGACGLLLARASLRGWLRPARRAFFFSHIHHFPIYPRGYAASSGTSTRAATRSHSIA